MLQSDIMTKQTKKEKLDKTDKAREIEKLDREIKRTDKIITILSFFFWGFVCVIFIAGFFVIISYMLAYAGIYAGMNVLHGISLWLDNLFAPTHTAYLSSTLFPLKANVYIYKVIPAEYAFYGTLQSNGTECISSVAVYSFNYTSQSIYSTPQTIISNPKEVADIYYYSEAYLNITIPNGYTLLCPNIVNATK